MGAAVKGEGGLGFLYDTAAGRLCLRVLSAPWVSRLGGAFLSTGVSRALVPGFIRKNGIDMGDYPQRRYASFNDFFTRELRPGARPVDPEPDALIAPCDSRASVYTITDGCRMTVKGQRYTVPELLGFEGEGEVHGPDDPLAELLGLADRLRGGTALVFRLCVDDYHRYIYLDDGEKGDNVFIPGVLHTVRPVALARVPVFVRNSREYTVLDTARFGRCIQVEVGAMLVGRIRNHHGAHAFRRGEEKGMFLFGGSTVVLLLEPGRALLRPDLEALRDADGEVRVRLGEGIGKAAQ